ncbi:hypothetical protein QKW60_00075 [Defluviimonas aestuarii]|uniref:hypothetical protein n=1 Tax=Albidovulum aestuarii TaxID=1130726 RepID=UPI00249A615A|nr:hypothetical protein [Defluviimonas aestuarii]MDI3334798.1 hypothetical protein [Defluviimonas aestuarii]
MNELEILKLVRSERKPYWGGKPDYTFYDLRSALGVVGLPIDLSDSLISNLLLDRPHADENKILRLISGPGERQTEARKKVEQSLGLEGLFLCTDRAEVLDLIARADGSSEQLARLSYYQEPPIQGYGITGAEQDAINYLAEELCNNDQPIFHCDVPFNSGASTVAQNLRPTYEEKYPYSKIVVIRPSDFTLPFEAELRKLCNELDAIGRPVETKRQLADSIIAERILLVVLSPFAIDVATDNNSLRSLTKEFRARHGQWRGPSNILFVGQSEWLSKVNIQNTEVHSRKMRRILRLRGEASFDEFRAQWKRFSDLREQSLSEESGSRMRRAATYFRIQNPDYVWPVSVKLRALFASNECTAAYFDPTQGFRRLAGARFDEFKDIRNFLEDVSDYIAFVRYLDRTAKGGSRGKRKYYYLLQYVSTAKHWLTEDALDVLIDSIDGERQNHLNLATEKKRIGGLAPVITAKNVSISGVSKANYFASIAVKAVVQDDWINTDPYARALAHYRIADRLKGNENDKELLDREFPYEPHWGRSRIFFLSETIRHLVRSTETFSGDTSSKEYDPKLKFPKAPTRDQNGTNPAQVINYCYETLYQKELNSNANGSSGRAMAKRYGAYQLAVELLELMSENYQIGVPHRALNPENRIEFMRECGFALLDVGELEKARDCFLHAQRSLYGDERAVDERAVDEINIDLDLALVESTRGKLSAAREAVDTALKKLQTLHTQRQESDARQYYTVRSLYRRVLTREAHLVFLEGDHELALDLIDRIENESRWEQFKDGDRYSRDVLVPGFSQRLEAEQTHLLIAALHRRAECAEKEWETSEFSVALNRCMEAMLRGQSEGLHHQAMGFRIALARCFRRMERFDTAEAILDAVHFDLLRYGCSERTFLSFLNEAGRVLAGLGDPIRAYATYLRPCFGRAKARGFRREAEQAAVLASNVLEEIKRQYEQCQSSDDVHQASWLEALTRAKDKHRRLIKEADDIFRGGPFEKDPLFAYAIADAEEVIETLTNSKGISDHASEVASILSEASA